jgi:MFS transporter, DHA1 family, multidrug resistance protein
MGSPARIVKNFMSDSSVVSALGRERFNSVQMIFILGMLTTFAPFATDMYLASFPAIAGTLSTSVDRVQFSLSTFMFGVAVGQLCYGPIIDRYGRRWPLMAGIALFILTSVAVPFCHDISVFIGLRFIQAVGGCAGMIISRAIIHDVFDQQQAARALSAMMVVQGIGPIAAPILGGYILILAGWHAIFVFLACFGGVCLWLVYSAVPETHVRSAQAPSMRQILATFWHLLIEPGFIVPTLSSSFAMASMFAFISGSPFVFMDLHGVSQQAYGWLFGLNALGMTIAGQFNRYLLHRYSPKAIYICALGVNIVAGLGLFCVSGSHALYVIVIPLFCCLAILPALGANGIAIAMSKSGANGGSASSLIGVIQFALAGLVSALVGMLHNGTAYPMSGLILGCALLSGLVICVGRKSLG